MAREEETTQKVVLAWLDVCWMGRAFQVKTFCKMFVACFIRFFSQHHGCTAEVETKQNNKEKQLETTRHTHDKNKQKSSGMFNQKALAILKTKTLYRTINKTKQEEIKSTKQHLSSGNKQEEILSLSNF